jgi:hypothetical protein
LKVGGGGGVNCDMRDSIRSCRAEAQERRGPRSGASVTSGSGESRTIAKPGLQRKAPCASGSSYPIASAPRRPLAPSGPWLRGRARSTRARVCAPRSSSRSLGPWLRGRARSTRARVCAPCSSSRALGPWLRGRARSTRFRSRSRPSLGGAGTRLRMRRSCRLRDSQSRAAQGRSVAADGASPIDWPRGIFVLAMRPPRPQGSDGRTSNAVPRERGMPTPHRERRAKTTAGLRGGPP